MERAMSNEHGSALMLTVIAMLVLGVLSVSFALLADMETKIGVSYKQQAAAEALAEAALEQARDAVRTAPVGTAGFSRWFDGTTASHNLFSNVPLVGGTYSARIDNDCAAANTVPTSIQEPPHPPGATPCNNTADWNETAVITGWAQAGTGRARVRAIVAVDNPWKHVCSDAKPDNNGYCNDVDNRNGSPTVIPSDPNDPNGPQGYNNLPRPILGCSRIAPELHAGPYLPALQGTQCRNTFPGMYIYPYPVAFNVVPRFVLMGEDPATTPTARTCNNEPAGGNGNVYFGYFDCALTSYCNPLDAGQVCSGFPNLIGGPPAASNTYRTGCLRGPRWTAVYGGQPDTRVVAVPGPHANMLAHNPGFNMAFPPPAGIANIIRWGEWDPVTGKCVNAAGTPLNFPNNPGGVNSTGLVFSGAALPVGGGTVNFDAVGSQTQQFNVYVFHAKWTQSNNVSFYGTIVVETNSANPPCTPSPPPADCTVQFQVGGGATSALWSGADTIPPAAAPAPWAALCCAGWPDPTAPGPFPHGFNPTTYGYPLVALIYDPFEAPPTITPTYAPQPHRADMGSNNTQIHGMIYSGGHVEFNPLALDGTVVGYEIQTQGSATYTYNLWYGDNTPPPGFPTGANDTVVIVRKSFVVCVNYNDDSAGPTICP